MHFQQKRNFIESIKLFFCFVIYRWTDKMRSKDIFKSEIAIFESLYQIFNNLPLPFIFHQQLCIGIFDNSKITYLFSLIFYITQCHWILFQRSHTYYSIKPSFNNIFIQYSAFWFIIPFIKLFSYFPWQSNKSYLLKSKWIKKLKK